MMTIHFRPILRTPSSSDLELMVSLFKETVHSVNANDYTSEQLLSWAPPHAHHGHARWQSLLENIAFVAEIDGVIVGFADLTHDGYLDRLFVHKNYQRQGIAAKLVRQLEQEAVEKGIEKITTEASITAKPFFEHMGYCVITEQDKDVNGVTLRNYLMEKYIG